MSSQHDALLIPLEMKMITMSDEEEEGKMQKNNHEANNQLVIK